MDCHFQIHLYFKEKSTYCSRVHTVDFFLEHWNTVFHLTENILKNDYFYKTLSTTNPNYSTSVLLLLCDCWSIMIFTTFVFLLLTDLVCKAKLVNPNSESRYAYHVLLSHEARTDIIWCSATLISKRCEECLTFKKMRQAHVYSACTVSHCLYCLGNQL